MSTAFLEANNIKIYTVLSDFAKCRDSRVKSAPQLTKIEGGEGVQPIRAMPIFRLFFFYMASLRCRKKSYKHGNIQPAGRICYF